MQQEPFKLYPQYYKHKILPRYRRSLSAQSFEHLITKQTKAENLKDNDDEGDEQDLTNAQTHQVYIDNIMMTLAQDITAQAANDGNDNDEEVLKVNKVQVAKDDLDDDDDTDETLMLKSNYDNKEILKEQQPTTTTPASIPSTTTTLTSQEFLPFSLYQTSSAFEFSKATTMSSYDDKTLKINNLLNLNQSNKHNINKENNHNNKLQAKQPNVQEQQQQQDIENVNTDLFYLEEHVSTPALINLSTINGEELTDEEVEATTKLYTIFENYNYDEEEMIIEDLNLDLKPKNIMKMSLKTPAKDNHDKSNAEAVIPVDDDNHYKNIDSKKINTQKNNLKNEKSKQTTNNNNKSTENDKVNYNNNNNNDENDKEDAENDDSNNFQINRLQPESINTVTVNSHQHLSDNYDDSYLSPQQNPSTALESVNERESLENLMLNDGLLPLNAQQGFGDINYAQHLEDIDIVKLEQTHSNEEELYKTINSMKNTNKPKSKKTKFQLNTTHYDKHQNEVILPQDHEKEMELSHSQIIYEKPITTAPILAQPQIPEHTLLSNTDNLQEKRIIVNLTIASNDGSGNMYSLHVNIPAFDQAGQVQNMQQVLTHEKLNIKQEQQQTEINTEKPKPVAPEQLKASPYCIPEPPPPIPECPCACGLYTTSSSSSLDPDLDNDWFQISSDSTKTTTTTPTAHHSLPPAILSNENRNGFNQNTDNINDIDNSVSVDFDFDTSTTATNSNMLDVITDDNFVTNLNVNSSNENGEKFACPDVMPILILEGDLY